MTQPDLTTGTEQNPPLSASLLFILALSAGAAVANIYYAQPLLAMIADSFNAHSDVGLIAMATQIGYPIGIVFFLPLGDLVERRRLTVSLSLVLVVGTLGCAVAPNVWMLMLASLVVGIGAAITQIMIPFAMDLAKPEQRGRAVGVVFSGLLTGILLARTISGTVGQVAGWRPMFVLASVIALALGLLLQFSLPRIKPKTSQTYSQLLMSLIGLLLKHRALRLACAIQACAFAIFSAFWTVLALLLANPPFNMGPAVAGAFGIIGLVGIGAANVGGRLVDRYGINLGLRLGLISCLAAWVIFALNLSLTGLVIGVVLLDFGLSMASVSNQSSILVLDSEARSRINSIYVTAIFFGGAFGSGLASLAWSYGGWQAVCMFGVAIAILALLIHLYGSLRR